jgi:hypothetical protein
MATLAALAAAFSPFADQTSFSGVAQRVLGLTVFAWLLVVAIRIRFRSGADGAQAGSR